MLERVIENWLNRVNERSMETPFCQLLTAEGFQVVHLSRHGPYEEGKDVLAIAPDGTPCAFQLKSGKITLKAWSKYRDQINRLVELPIVHPSIDKNLQRKVFLVTNGEFDEEVRLEIEHLNYSWLNRGLPKLETVVKGQLLKRFSDTTTNLWSIQLESEKTLLEFFLAEGIEGINKDKLAHFVQSLLPLSHPKVKKSESHRIFASAAILTTYALSPYAEKANHVALIEGWMVFIACFVAYAEKYKIAEKHWKRTLEIVNIDLAPLWRTRKMSHDGAAQIAPG